MTLFKGKENKRENNIIKFYLHRIFSSLFFAAFIPIVGWVADIFSLSEALLILGAASLGVGLVFLFILRYCRVI